MKSLVKYIAAALVLSIFTACESKWEEHIATKDLRGKTLMQAISENPQTTVFATILQKSGYDNLLSGDRMMTVFAPVNEALASVDMNDVEGLKNLVRNHLAYSNYTVIEGHFSSDRVEMINSKNYFVNGLQINKVGLINEAQKFNLSTGNGILHLMSGIIPGQKNIWEYLQTQSGNLQAEFIKNQDKLIMDMTKSVQIGVDPRSGKPLYDTVWVNRNPFLNAYPINDETKNYTYALLPNEVIQRIEAKYAKYFAKQNATKQDSIVRAELIKDCILVPVVLSGDSRYISIDGVLMDISASKIQETYAASNGTVYKLSDADVKIYENKVKTIKIEGENYFSFYADNMNAWMMRYRPSLSGGKDMCLNSPTTYNTTYVYSDADTTINVAIARTFAPNNAASNAGRTNNCYIEYRPVINSVAYKVYWAAYDDYNDHINLPVTLSINTGTSTVSVNTNVTCMFSQKMLLSFPDMLRVARRPSDGTIANNFSISTVLASPRFTAGLQEEKQVYRCLRTEDAAQTEFGLLQRNTTNISEEDFFNYYTGSDQFGDKEMIISPTYGEATVFVANSSEYKATNSGMVFVDYIKLVPVVDPNE